MIRKILIKNYRLFEDFELELSPTTNILVGANDTGKSTLIEAINLALTFRLNGWPISRELTPFHFNQNATRNYIDELVAAGGRLVRPPELLIEVYLDQIDGFELLDGNNNACNEPGCGVRLIGNLSQDYVEEYREFISDPSKIRLVPAEYYEFDWLGFSGNAVTARSVPAIASVIDPTSTRLQSGVDFHLQEIIRTYLDPNQRVELSRQYRSIREEFSEKESVKEINLKLCQGDTDLTDRELSLGVDISQRFTWESSLIAHLDNLPFPYVGKGEQNSLKILLAIGRKAVDAKAVLIEEPETHLSFAALRQLISRIENQCADKQLIIATHSTYVLNKLGIQNLILLGNGTSTRLTDLPKDTVEYFKKLSGYDTLRLVLSKGAILVEGPSDELIIQRAYRDLTGKLPIESGIDVISVGMSHKRFLDIASRLLIPVRVVTDNDHKSVADVSSRFSDYGEYEFIQVHTGTDPKLNTLEPTIAEVNELEVMNRVFGENFSTKSQLVDHMLQNKTSVALAIFETVEDIRMPSYIEEAVRWEEI